MADKRIAVLEGNAETARELTDALKSAGFDVCIETDDGAEGLARIETEQPDAGVISLVLKRLDGFGVLDGLRVKGLAAKAVVLGSFSEEEIISRVLEKGAKYYLIKPVRAQVVTERIQELFAERAQQPAAAQIPAAQSPAALPRERRGGMPLEEKISNIFIAIGIPPHIKGYAYLREGIRLAVEDPSIINSVTKRLYPAIAEKYGTSASKVERAIRHGIEVAWNRQRTEAINAVFGVRVYIGSEKPTNSEFIALVADKLLLEGLTDNS